MISSDRLIAQDKEDELALRVAMKAYYDKAKDREAARSDIFKVGQLLDVGPEWMPPHMQGWWDLCQQHKKLYIMAAYGHLKSNFLWLEMKRSLLMDPEHTQFLLIRETDKMVRHSVSRIKRALTSPAVVELFGDMEGDTWSDEELRMREIDPGLLGGSLFGVGIGGAVEGFRGNGLRTDDMVGFKKARSAADREFIEDWFRGQVWPRINWNARGSSFLGISSPWHPDDVNGTVLKMSKESGVSIFVKIYPGIMKGDRMALPEDFPLQGGSDVRLLWEKHLDQGFTIDDMNLSFRTLGRTMFMARVQCDVNAMLGSLFKSDWLQYISPDDIPKGLFVVQGWDFAITEKSVVGTKSKPKSDPDYTWGWTVGYDSVGGLFYLLDCFAGQIGDGHVQKMVNLASMSRTRWGNPDPIMCEAIAFQDLIRRSAQNVLPQVVSVKHHSKDKVARILNLQRYFENGKVLIRDDMPNRELFEGQFVDFPNGTHDDGMDALEITFKGIIASGGVGDASDAVNELMGD